MADIFDYKYLLEKIDSESPGDVTVAPGATEATLFFIINYDDLYKTFISILGYTKVSDDGPDAAPNLGFDRQLPMSHPRYPFLYAESIEIVGYSPNGKVTYDSLKYPEEIFASKSAKPINYKTNEFFENYKMARIAVKFTSRNYQLLANKQIKLLGAKSYPYWIRNNKRNNGVEGKSYFDLHEMLRYTEVFVEPNNEIIANTTGKGFWKSKNQQGQVGPEAPTNDAPITIENTSTNFQTIVKNKYKVKWYQIPKTLFRPAINKLRPWDYAVSTLNFGANYDDDAGNIDIWNYNLFNWVPGTMLYTGYELEDASSSFPFIPYNGDQDELPFNYLKNQYYNVTYNFIQFTIPKDQIVLPDIALFGEKLGKMYSTGWNFVPQPNRMFYYIESQNSANQKGMPPYFSFPHQALFNPRMLIDL